MKSSARHSEVAKQSTRPRIDIFRVFMAPEVLPELARTFETGYIGQGARVATFETELRSLLGFDQILTTNSATSALHLALHLVTGDRRREASMPQIQRGDEVLTTPLTCVATNWPILANGLRPRWCDINAGDLNIDPAAIAKGISRRTKIILVVHWGGYPVDLDAVRQVANEAETRIGFRPIIVEDCAHALGSTYKGRMIGTSGNIAAFSFQAVKTITCGDGGALAIPDSTLFRRAVLARWYGIDREASGEESLHERDIQEWGFKFHMNDIAATIGSANLRHVHSILQCQRANARLYDDALANCDGVTRLMRAPDRLSSSYLYTIRVKDRSRFTAHMAEHGIEARRVHARNDWHSCVSEFRTPLATLDTIYDEIVCLPVGWWLTREDVEYVVACIRQGW